MHRSPQYFHSCKAFTLLETVLVVAIIGVLSAIAIPRYANANNHYRVATLARRITADIAFTRARARSISTSQSIAFSVPLNQYQITGLADPDHPAAIYTVSFSDRSLSGTLVSATFGLSSTLTFNGYGVPSSSGTIQITSGTASATILVDADSGKTTIQ